MRSSYFYNNPRTNAATAGITNSDKKPMKTEHKKQLFWNKKSEN